MKIKDYCKERFTFLWLIFIYAFIYFIVLFVYQVPLEPLLYAFLLSFIFFFALCIYDYFSIKKNI